jgi:hypothetical protein
LRDSSRDGAHRNSLLSSAQLLGVANSAEEFATLMAIARDRAQQMGTTTAQAFNDLVTGLGRGSPMILDNLGITISVTEANKAYAAQLGKNVSALTEAEQKQALINAVLQQGKETLDKTGGAAESNAGKFERFGTAIENLKNRAGGVLANIFAPVADAGADVIGVLDGTSESAVKAYEGYRQLTGVYRPLTDAEKCLVDNSGGAGGDEDDDDGDHVEGTRRPR